MAGVRGDRENREQILVGLGNYNTYSAPGFPGYPGFHGFALRFFDPQTGVWRIWWASTIGRGQLDTPVVGQFGDGEGRFGCDDLLGGRAAKVRFDWKDITPFSARWEQSFSFDDGRTFDTNWIMEFTRMPLDPAPVNPHEGSGGSRSARSAQHLPQRFTVERPTALNHPRSLRYLSSIVADGSPKSLRSRIFTVASSPSYSGGR